MRSLIFLMWLGLALGARGESVCLRLLSALPQTERSARDFWAQNIPYKAGLDHDALAFKFGFDAELWHLHDIVNIISQDAASFQGLDTQLRSHGPHYTQNDLVTMLGLSSTSQLSSFLRNSPRNGRYVLTDITVAGLARWKHGNQVKSDYAPLLQPWANQSLQNRNIPVEAKLETDSGPGHEQAVELVMKGAMEKPAEFKKLIDWLYSEVEWPETHFHVSLPIDHVSAEQTLYAARALETKILLELMLTDRDFNGETYHPHDDTSFSKDAKYVRENELPQIERGIVRVESERWEEPFLAHDVEIRDWIDKDHGLENMYFMMQMVRYSNHLRGRSSFQAPEMRNTMPPNLNGALRYAAVMLKERLPEDKKRVHDELIALATELEAAGKLNDTLRKKVADYLRRNDILRLLNMNVFMREDVFSPPPRGASTQPPPAPPENVPIDEIPLPETYLVNSTRFRFANPDQDESIVRVRTHHMEHQRNPVFLADFTIDWSRPFRSDKFKAQQGEKVVFFDWVEPDVIDQAKVFVAAKEVLKQTFQLFKQDRIVAISDSDYAESTLVSLGFTPIQGVEQSRSSKRWELKRANFR